MKSNNKGMNKKDLFVSLVTNELKRLVEEGIPLSEEVVKEKYANKTEKELHDIIWAQIKELNQTFPRYKHIQKMILTNEELIKTSTKKVKRQEEMKKIMAEI